MDNITSSAVDRSSRAEVRNPLLALKSAKSIKALPKEHKDGLRVLLMELRKDAHAKAETAWKRRKGPQAVYWRAVGVYAGHIARVLRD